MRHRAQRRHCSFTQNTWMSVTGSWSRNSYFYSLMFHKILCFDDVETTVFSMLLNNRNLQMQICHVMMKCLTPTLLSFDEKFKSFSLILIFVSILHSLSLSYKVRKEWFLHNFMHFYTILHKWAHELCQGVKYHWYTCILFLYQHIFSTSYLKVFSCQTPAHSFAAPPVHISFQNTHKKMNNINFCFYLLVFTPTYIKH